MDILKYVVGLLEEKYGVEGLEDPDAFNYVESGYVDSIGIIQFIAELEDKFSVEFTDDEIASEEFKTVGGVAGIIARKLGKDADGE